MKKLLILALVLVGCGQGPVGASGSNGSSCTVSQISANDNLPDGGALISCADGTRSLIANGTLITPVQFCPETPVYPSVFPEVGFVMHGKIYAVYSTNDGFLTLLMPGRYTSNAVGSRCDFTINSDYTISY